MIPKEVIEDYELESYKNEWLRGLVDLPNRTFLHFFKEVNGYVINITIQNYENKEIIDKLLSIVDRDIIKKEIDFSKIKLRKIKLDGVESFDSLIFASFEYSLLPNSDFVDFDKKRVNIYPIYNHELTGEESKKDIKSITRKVLSTTEWNREPVPLVRYKFTNPKHQYGTVGKSLVIDKEENVYSALKNFETNDCIMEVQNYLNTKLIITFNKEKKHIKITGDKELILTTEEALVYLKSFFRR